MIRGGGSYDFLTDGGSAHTDTMYGGSDFDFFYLCPDGTPDEFPDFSTSEGDQKIRLTDDPDDLYYDVYLEYCT